MASCHEGTPAGCTDGVHVVVLEDEATVGQAVYVWGRDLVGPVETYIIPALDTVVSKYNYVFTRSSATMMMICGLLGRLDDLSKRQRQRARSIITPGSSPVTVRDVSRLVSSPYGQILIFTQDNAKWVTDISVQSRYKP